ncbi:hypothetical protein LTS18_012125, partial [Coniosporium uncinatum]
MFLDAVQLGTSPAAPAMLTWSLIVWHLRVSAVALREFREHLLESSSANTRSRTSSTSGLSAVEECIERIMSETEEDEDPIAFLGQSAIETVRAYHVMAVVNDVMMNALCGSGIVGHAEAEVANVTRHSFLNTIAIGADISEFNNDVISAIASLLSRHKNFWHYVDQSSQSSNDSREAVVRGFVETEQYQILFDEALLRYPAELGPFLRFWELRLMQCDTHDDGTYLFHPELLRMETFTLALPPYFDAYRVTGEQIMQLEDTIPLFPSLRKAQSSFLIRNGPEPDQGESNEE